MWLVLFDPKAAPVLFFGGALLGALGEPLLPGDRRRGGPAPGPDRGPADGELDGHGRAAPWPCSSACSSAGGWPTSFGDVARDRRSRASSGSWPRSSRPGSGARCSPTTCPRRRCATSSGASFASSPTVSRRLVRTPRALGPITSITLDQVGQGIVLVLSLFVFRDRFEEGVGSFSNLIGAGGLGVLLGILTVGQARGAVPEGADRRARVLRRRRSS